MTELSKTLFWIALVLITEPALASIWPRIRAALFLSYPYNVGKMNRIEAYYSKLSLPFHIMAPFRKRLRCWMQTIGVLILIFITSNLLFH